jgi:hypothetical protein
MNQNISLNLDHNAQKQELISCHCEGRHRVGRYSYVYKGRKFEDFIEKIKIKNVFCLT